MQVFSFDAFCMKINDLKLSEKTVGLCHGCFDVLHLGHIRHFKFAKTQCDYLFVSVTADRFVNKGPNRPLFHDYERAEIISSLHVVSGVVINETATSMELLRNARPTIFFKGQEYLENALAVNPNFIQEKGLALELGIDVQFTLEEVFSSSEIISRLMAT